MEDAGCVIELSLVDGARDAVVFSFLSLAHLALAASSNLRRTSADTFLVMNLIELMIFDSALPNLRFGFRSMIDAVTLQQNPSRADP